MCQNGCVLSLLTSATLLFLSIWVSVGLAQPAITIIVKEALNIMEHRFCRRELHLNDWRGTKSFIIAFYLKNTCPRVIECIDSSCWLHFILIITASKLRIASPSFRIFLHEFNNFQTKAYLLAFYFLLIFFEINYTNVRLQLLGSSYRFLILSTTTLA